MGFLAYWPLAFLVLIPIIIILYILRQETKPQQFSSTMLWQEAVRNIEATKPWERLRKNILLFLQILTVLLFILAMMGPWLKNIGKEQSQLVLVIDNSASMETIYEDDTTRLEAAKKAACAYVDDSSSSTALYVISGNQSAILELSNSTDKLEAKKVINSIEQTSLVGDMSTSLGLVSSCISQYQNPQVIFFTDTAFDVGDMDASVASFYSQGVNFSVDGLSYAWDEDTLLVLVQLTNYSDAALSREINLYGINKAGESNLLEIKEVNLDANESTSAYIEVPYEKTEGITSICAELNEADALAGDNTCYCTLEETSESQVLLVSDSNMFIEKAFANLAGVEISRTDDLSVVGGDTKYDLYIFDGMVPSELPETGSFLFINCEYEDFVSKTKTVEKTILTLLDTDLSTYIVDAEIGVNSSMVYEVPGWGNSFLDSSEGSAGYYGIYDGHKVATLGFDLHQSDFGLQAEFPVLISNMAQYLLNGSLTEENSFVAGDSVMLHGSTKGSDLTLVNPDLSQIVIEASGASGSYLQVTEPGIYSVSQTTDDATVFQQFAVLFPVANESQVEAADSMIGENGTAKAADVKTGVLELRNYILIFLLILMLVEWVLYLRLR